MKNVEGFSKTGNWYKGNLHCHSTNSDGKLSPKEVVDLFKENGYSFLCFSDHDIYTDYRSEFDSEDFIILPGLEASVNLFDESGKHRMKVHHIHGILGTSEMEEKTEKKFAHLERRQIKNYFGSWDGKKAAQELCDEMRSYGMITTYNHPIWSRVSYPEFCDLEGIWALEIFNYNTVNESNTGYDEVYWDEMLRDGKKMLAFASDDNHNEGLFDDACGGYMVVKSDRLDREEILRNMLKGNYYSSSGVAIEDWGIKDGVVYVKCENVYRIDFVAGNCVNDGISLMSKTRSNELTYGEYKLKGHEKYVRVKCSDIYGRTAWTNPIYLDERQI